jgi:hypothetical protein
MYALISSLDNSSPYLEVDFCDTFEKALRSARERADDNGFPCLIFEERLEVGPLEREAGADQEAAYNGVLPGSNFPASLRKPGGAVL